MKDQHFKNFLIVGTFMVLMTGKVQSQELDKYRAVFILKFIENIQWPNDPSSISVGVLGNSRVLTELGNRISSSQLRHKVGRIDYLDKAVDFDIVFVPDGVGVDIETVVKAVGGRSILVVAQSASKENQSADICFLREDNKLKFVLNTPAISDKGLVVSSKLQKFAATMN